MSRTNGRNSRPISLELSYSSRQLADELMARIPVILGRQFARRLRTRHSQAGPTVNVGEETPFGGFTLADGVSIPLWPLYRNRIKGHWAQAFWPVSVLSRLDRLAALPPEWQALAARIRSARTLPVSLREISAAIAPLAADFPADIVQTPRHDPFLETRELAVVPEPGEVRERVRSYLEHARRLLARFQRHVQGSASHLRILEQGCGGGYTTMALASLGVGEAVGVDIAFDRYRVDPEWQMVQEEFLHTGREAASPTLHQGDAMALPHGDATFDVVHSISTVEHISRPELALREAYRVLRPGGIAYFEVDPWFGPHGGHSLCTLDCPWGHVRLDASEFDAYVALHRPHEARQALEFYRDGFQSPRLTAAQIEGLIVASGFRILDWHEGRDTHSDHYALITPRLLNECQRVHPLVTVRDLMASSYVTLLERS